MQKEKMKALQKYLKSVGKFARQPVTLSRSSSIPISGPEQPPIQSDPCAEQQTALDGALVDIDNAAAALNTALGIAAERLQVLDACRLRNRA